MADGKSTGTPYHKRRSRKQETHPRDLDARRSALEDSLRDKGVLKELKQEVEKQGVPSGVAQAIRLSSEFFAAIVVGVILGLGFDQLAGASPWGLIVFLFLGFASGVLNVLRSVGFAAPGTLGKTGTSVRRARFTKERQGKKNKAWTSRSKRG